MNKFSEINGSKKIRFISLSLEKETNKNSLTSLIATLNSANNQYLKTQYKKIFNLISKELKDELFKNYNGIEVGLDECARGVMFGRLYAAAVIMPKEKLQDNMFDKIKDSKKLS